MTALRTIMGKLRLTVNEQKTRQCRIPDESFDFLGYTIGCSGHRPQGGPPQPREAYIGTRPSQKKITRLCREISEMTSRRWSLLPVEDRVAQINRKLIGWSNYFCLGPVSKAYRAVDRHVCHRLRQWFVCQAHGAGSGNLTISRRALHQTLGLVQLPARTRNFSWANS